jgi:hypothetical protein
VNVPKEAKPGDKLTLNIVGFKLDAQEYNRINWTLNILGHKFDLAQSDWFLIGNSNATSPEINVDLGVVWSPDGGGGGGGQPLEVCRFRLGQKYYEAAGRQVQMDTAPYVKNGRSYLSIRYLANALGVRDQDITWDPSTRKVVLRKGDIILYFMVGSREMMRTDARTSSKNFIQMDVAPEINNGRVCLPARYVAEGFGYRVRWDPATQAILVGLP